MMTENIRLLLRHILPYDAVVAEAAAEGFSYRGLIESLVTVSEGMNE